jgi:hypothetical protein
LSVRRHFTLAQAHALLPEVNRYLARASTAQAERQRAKGDLMSYRRRLVLSGGVIPNANRMGAFEDQAKIAHQVLSHAVNSLEEMGLEVKDIERGIVDFPTRYQGETVYLCFRAGEDEIRFWHGVEEGFKGRKPIDDEFLKQHSD